MNDYSRKLLRVILALVYGAVFLLLSSMAVSLLKQELDFAGESYLYAQSLHLSLPVLSLLVAYKAYKKGWGMPAYLMAPPPSSTPDE